MPRANILLVDDLQANLNLLTTGLKSADYFTKAVTSGQQALDAVHEMPPDLILLDIMMPDMDGYEVCHRIKANPDLVDIPIIFLSALDGTFDKVKAFQVGATDFINKPFDFDELLARIETHLTLYRQKREIQHQKQLKSRFLSIASHEFRTPLSVIKTCVDLLRLYPDHLTPAQQADKLEAINTEVRQLNELVDNILFINKIESGSFAFEPEVLDFRDFLQRLVRKFSASNPTKPLEFTSEILEPLVYLDATLMRHILSNLLSNAFKYSPDGSPVKFVVQQTDADIVFSVQDQGMGIPAAEQANLFEPFFRASNAKAVTGTGLGLSIVKEFVGMHGGKLHFESRENGGTRFMVTIPLKVLSMNR